MRCWSAKPVHSAGSEPGPACYGRGGKEATVTDASVVLGWLNPASFAGGSLSLDPSLAHGAIERRIAQPLGLSVEDAAHGMHRSLLSAREGPARSPAGCSDIHPAGAIR
jgi:N-methylhydantoinase A/oxoprolinase/acetone carboxylase beta subunit